jgi:hypothetical protein
MGPACWTEIRDELTRLPLGWNAFKDFINNLYGLSEEELSD